MIFICCYNIKIICKLLICKGKRIDKWLDNMLKILYNTRIKQLIKSKMLNPNQIKEMFQASNPDFAAKRVLVTFAADARATVIGHIVRVIDNEYNTIHEERINYEVA